MDVKVLKVKKIFSLSKGKAVLLLSILISLFIFQWTDPSVASLGKPLKTEPRLVPASLLSWPKEGADYAILVDKSAQKVFVYHWNNLFTPLKVYTCSTGENNGPKSK